jgi:hypothetical protein
MPPCSFALRYYVFLGISALGGETLMGVFGFG